MKREGGLTSLKKTNSKEIQKWGRKKKGVTSHGKSQVRDRVGKDNNQMEMGVTEYVESKGGLAAATWFLWDNKMLQK